MNNSLFSKRSWHYLKERADFRLIFQFLITRLIIISRNIKESIWVTIDSKTIKSTDNVLFVDLGANVGQAYTWFRTFFYLQNVTFELFEPNPNCCKKLKQIPEIVSGEVKLIEAAASTFSGKTPFYGITPNDGDIFSVGGTISKKNITHIHNEPGQYPISVEVIDFCEYIKNKAPLFDKIFVKMDIEGAELSLLESLIKLNLIGSIDIIYVEFHSRFQKPEDAKISYKRELNIIREIANIPSCKLRIWH